MRITAIDPGSERSAFVRWSCEPPQLIDRGTVDNDALAMLLMQWSDRSILVVEMIASYGMPVGAEVFETCVWIGQFLRCWHGEKQRLFRRDVKLNLCGDSRAKDSNIRQAIIDRFGGKEKAIGKKATPGPLYGIKGDEWSALAVALTYADKQKKPSPERVPF